MLEIVITGRNDDFGGADFVDRLCAAAARNHARLEAAGVAHTFTLAEWNPPPDRPLLAEIVTARLGFWGRALVADPEWHRRLSQNPRLEFMEFFAKNAAIRRSVADAILTTNSDVFLSDALIARLAEVVWRDETVYRATRHDVDRTIDWREVPESVFADPARHIRVNHLAGPEFGTAAGDFLLLTRTTFQRFRGFNETVRYAKIHKDGQFCFRAWLEGLPVEPLGPIWHIDHDGSYANAGAGFGAPDAPYGPEWNYRVDYRNPASWGLSAAIEDPVDGRITWLRHPSTHGPAISVIVAGSTAGEAPALDTTPTGNWERVAVAGAPIEVGAINDAIATARGRFLLLSIFRPTFPQSFPQGDSPQIPGDGDSPQSQVTDELKELVALVRERRPDLVAVGGACGIAADGRITPHAGAPFGFSRDVYEAIGDLRELTPDPALDFWARAVAGRAVAIWHPARDDWAPAIEHTRACPAALGDPLDPAAAARELAAAISDAPAWIARWIGTLELPSRSALAILGPDWATPFLLAGVRAAGHSLVALVSLDPRQCGTHQYGESVRSIESVAGTGATMLLGASAAASLAERLRVAGYTGRVATWLPTVPQSMPPDFSSELDVRRARHADAVAAGRLAEVLEGLPALCMLEGVRQFGHRYDAALLAERSGRLEAARRLFASAAGEHNADEALRMRATFHEARLLLSAGQPDAALGCLDRVLAYMRGHIRALALAAEAFDQVPGAPVSDALRARLRARSTEEPRVSARGGDS